jgi:hypothetical protein
MVSLACCLAGVLEKQGEVQSVDVSHCESNQG